MCVEAPVICLCWLGTSFFKVVIDSQLACDSTNMKQCLGILVQLFPFLHNTSNRDICLLKVYLPLMEVFHCSSPGMDSSATSRHPVHLVKQVRDAPPRCSRVECCPTPQTWDRKWWKTTWLCTLSSEPTRYPTLTRHICGEHTPAHQLFSVKRFQIWPIKRYIPILKTYFWSELRQHLIWSTSDCLYLHVKHILQKSSRACQNRCNWHWKLFILCILVLKGINNLFVTARRYANCKINSTLLILTAFWKWKYQRVYFNRTGGKIFPRPQINSRSYPRDLLNSVFWQRCRFYSPIVATSVDGVCVCCT